MKKNKKNKTYPFSRKGLTNAVLDSKSEKIGTIVDIGFWVVMIVLSCYGIIKLQTLYKMVAYSGVAKIVQWKVG